MPHQTKRYKKMYQREQARLEIDMIKYNENMGITHKILCKFFFIFQ